MHPHAALQNYLGRMRAGLLMLERENDTYENEQMAPGCTAAYWWYLLRFCTDQLRGAADAAPAIERSACTFYRSLPVLLYMYLKQKPLDTSPEHASHEHNKKLVEAAVKLILDKPVVPGYGDIPTLLTTVLTGHDRDVQEATAAYVRERVPDTSNLLDGDVQQRLVSGSSYLLDEPKMQVGSGWGPSGWGPACSVAAVLPADATAVIQWATCATAGYRCLSLP
jgi:hypothetical protein